MRVLFASGGMNLNHVKLISGTSTVTSPESGSGAKGGTAWALPGTVQGEDFDLGGANVGYRDNTAGNSGGKYRSTDVDIEATGDSGGGYNVGWVSAGEWLKYTVNVTTAGTYTLTARVASSGSGGSFHVEFNGTNKTGTMSVPNTGGWQAYRDVTATVSLSAGVQVMRLVFDSNGPTGAIGNVNYLRLASGSTPPPTTTTSGKIRVMTWNVHFGKNASNVLNLDGQAKLMADSRADVILLQEASTWDGDQPNSFPAKLKALTGNTWYKVWSSHNGTGSGEGTLILTRLPIVSSSIANYNNRGFSRVAVSVSGVTIDIFNGHLDVNTSLRTSELRSWMAWMDTFSGPEIAGGDFNAWWGESWIKIMETKYSDTWQDYTGSDQNGHTIGNVRFDYLFRSRDSNGRLTPTAASVVSTSTLDHRPVIADYVVR
jgi:endonuclease/exonuclease/phosphatase family metal-dependent hydrolase